MNSANNISNTNSNSKDSDKVDIIQKVLTNNVEISHHHAFDDNVNYQYTSGINNFSNQDSRVGAALYNSNSPFESDFIGGIYNATPVNFKEENALYTFKIVIKLDSNSNEADLFGAVNPKTQQRCVLKLYKTDHTINEDNVLIIGNLNCRHVSKIFGYGKIQNRQYLVLPYFKNGSLDDFLKSGKRMFSLSQLKRNLILPLNEALHLLHIKDICHKNLKPSNIFFNDFEQVELIDFSYVDTIFNKNINVAPYTAPESLYGSYSYLSDYYSLGIIIYQAFCGHLPFDISNLDEISRYLSEDIRFQPEDEFPKELQNLILGLTYKNIHNQNDVDNPNKRWSYEEVVKWLNNEEQYVPCSFVNTNIDVNENKTINNTQIRNKGLSFNRISNGSSKFVFSSVPTIFTYSFARKISNFITNIKYFNAYHRTNVDITEIELEARKYKFTTALCLIVIVVLCLLLFVFSHTEKSVNIENYKYMTNDELIKLTIYKYQDLYYADNYKLLDNNLKVGDTVLLGNYWQTNKDEKEPIEWRVLKVVRDKALITTVKGLDAQPFNKSKRDTTWEESYIRKWLNNDFYSEAFCETEIPYISETKITPSINYQFNNAKTGLVTLDNVFLLSNEEVNYFFMDNEDRKLEVTNFAKLRVNFKGGDEHQTAWWWVNMPGNSQELEAYVDEEGNLNPWGTAVNQKIGVVRPAMWVNLID